VRGGDVFRLQHRTRGQEARGDGGEEAGDDVRLGTGEGAEGAI
jgi:hypothetical protein